MRKRTHCDPRRPQFQGSREAQEALQTALLPQLGRGGVIESGPEAVPAAVRDAAGERERIFVVHGHDRAAREQLELILHRLDLDPFVLANTGGGGLTIIEALEREIGLGPGGSHFGIVLMTPDDFGYSREDGPARAEPRARQNVVLEMGMLLVALGRPNVAILKKGHVEVPSDAQGIIYIPFNDHVREAVPRLVDRLREAGFDLDPRAITRASA